ncbi:MAG: hypothetical protein WAX14_09445 [Rhodococcus sp. (in: high G+C Gram-positive bacteria)]|uniref:hypothetical protein n=1 Tax=Rhodococcus sp. TaxID=1831 RepID=UPI003BB53871
MTDWIEVLVALSAGPDLPLYGTIRAVQPADHTEQFMVARPTMLVAVGDGSRVWRRGARLRVERDDGTLVHLTDGTDGWDFTRDAARPRVGPADRVHYLGDKQFLLHRRSASEWAGDDFAQPTGPVEEVDFAGRRCWTVELAPPPRKPYPMRIWVDIESGQMLGYRVEQAGVGAQFVDLVVGEDIDDEMFVWTGPVLTADEEQQQNRDRRSALEREQTGWFRSAVTDGPIRTRVPLDFTPDRVPFSDPETGAFDAMNDRTMLSRRPRGADGWEPRWGVLFYVWSTPAWDWAAGAVHADVDDDAIEHLQRSLHPGEQVDRQRRIDSDPRRRGDRR